MVIEFQLRNAEELIIGCAKIQTSIETLESALIALKTVGAAYTECRTVRYHIYYQDHGPHAEHGTIYIPRCQEDY